MNKLLVAPLLALAAIVPAVLPAQAQTSNQSVPFCTGGEDISADADLYAMKLRANGIDASSVDEWNGCLRAYVTTASGERQMMLFDPDTLAPVGRTARL